MASSDFRAWCETNDWDRRRAYCEQHGHWFGPWRMVHGYREHVCMTCGYVKREPDG